MGIAFVQAKSSTAGSAGATSAALAFNSNVTAGNFIVVMVGGSTGTSLTVTDSLSNTYHQIYLDTTSFGASNARSAWYAFNIAGGANTVTASWSGSSQFGAGICIAEYSGLRTSSDPFDQKNTNTGSGSTWSTGSIITTKAAELIMAFGTEANGNTTGPNSPFTQRATISTSIVVDVFGEQIVSATGSYSATGGGSGGNFNGTIASFIGAVQPVFTGIQVIIME